MESSSHVKCNYLPLFSRVLTQDEAAKTQRPSRATLCLDGFALSLARELDEFSHRQSERQESKRAKRSLPSCFKERDQQAGESVFRWGEKPQPPAQ